MRLTCFYLISALGLSIGLVEIRHEKEHRKQERLVSEMLYLTDQSINQTGPLLNVLSEDTDKFKKLSKLKEVDLLRKKHTALSSSFLQFDTKLLIEKQGITPNVINQIYSTLTDADALLNRTKAIVRREIKPAESTSPFPILRDALLQYPLDSPIQGKFDLFWSVRDETQFTQAIVDGNIFVSPKFPIHVPKKYYRIELALRNPVTKEEMIFRQTGQ